MLIKTNSNEKSLNYEISCFYIYIYKKHGHKHFLYGK
jgi:hypothetical protein